VNDDIDEGKKQIHFRIFVMPEAIKNSFARRYTPEKGGAARSDQFRLSYT